MTERLRMPGPHVVVAGLVAGLAGSLAARTTTPALPFVAVLLALAALALPPTRRAAALAAALLVTGLWWGSERLEAVDSSALEPLTGETALARLEVTGPPRRTEFAVRVPVRVVVFDGVALDERARLELPTGRAPPQGAIVETVASVKRPRPAERDGGFDEAAYLGRQGVHAVLSAGWFREVGRRDGLAGIADRLRAALEGSISPGVEGERKALIAGVVLGTDEGLSGDLRDAFRASGLFHLLAVSGQNVAYVVFGALLLAWVIGLPRWAGHVTALAGVAGYVAAVGWQPSVVRAGIAGALASLAWLAARPTDRWYFLLVGAAVLLAVNPYNLLEPGFQLSFAAVASIFLAVGRLERRLEGYPLPKKAAAGLAVSIACGIATAPVVWLHFDAVPVYSVLANAIAAPVVPPLLGAALACAALEPLVPSAALALAWANGWLAAYLAWCARLVGDLPYAQVGSLEALGAIAGMAAFVALALRLRGPRALRLAGLVAMALALVVGWRVWIGETGAAAGPPSGLRVTFLDVGQGDAILLEVPDGAMLVDQGPPEGEAAEQLDRLGVERLTALVLTHPQRDHVGGAPEVLETTDVGVVLDPRIPVESPDERAALAAAAAEEIRVVTAEAGQNYRLGRLHVRVLWPEDPGSPAADPNDHAIVLLATYGETDVLLTADAESNVTLRVRPPPVEVLKVAHHGSADAGLADLLALTRPRIAVISVGARNDYGHPAPSTLAALDAAPGLAVYRTDEDGRVVVESDGERLAVDTER